MSRFERIAAPDPGEIVGIPLRIGEKALSVLRIQPEIMDRSEAPGVALIELGDDVFALGGKELERVARARGLALPTAEEIASQVTTDVLHSKLPETVSLAIPRLALTVLAVKPSDFDRTYPPPPEFGIAQFGEVYRLGGDLIADYIQAHGARPIWGSDLDNQGHDNTGENTFN